jgi:hypothetical protein
VPPQEPQASPVGVISISLRGTWSGIGRRFGLAFPVGPASSPFGSGSFSLAIMAAAASSLVSSANCNWLDAPDDVP